jgi:small multidrug resistance family-3 protein
MNPVITPLLLLFAACLEVGGDAIVRLGLKSHAGASQLFTIALGGVVLLAYGIFVNLGPLDFGRLLGGYVVIFFIVAQLVNLLLFGIRPGTPIIAGGALILAGGILTMFWKT